jgi:hypothetical protein
VDMMEAQRKFSVLEMADKEKKERVTNITNLLQILYKLINHHDCKIEGHLNLEYQSKTLTVDK